MKKYLYIFLVFSLSILPACEKVIDVDLNSTGRNLVVDAKLYDGENDFVVFLSQTIDFFNSDEAEFIDDATVTLSTASGGVETLQYINIDSTGFYVLPAYEAIVGETYTLTIELDGEIYEATTTMPKKPIIDSTFTQFDPGNAFIDEGYDVINLVQDIAGENGYYRLWYTLNDTIRNKISDMMIFDDEVFQEGILYEVPIFVTRFQPGDRVGTVLLSMDENVYDYYETLQDLITDQGGGSSAAPANPNTNLSNGALGVFAAFSSATSFIEVEE